MGGLIASAAPRSDAAKKSTVIGSTLRDRLGPTAATESGRDAGRWLRLELNANEDFAVLAKGSKAIYAPSSSPTGFMSSTRSHTALTAINSGTPSNRPQMPHSQPQASTPTKIATGFMRLARLVSQGVTR